MKTVAFLQNMWVKNPERVRWMIAQNGERYRRRLIEMLLFAGCLTGRRLRAAFGDELLAGIVWEETTRQIAGDPKTIFPTDLEHICGVLAEEKPDVVLTFGKIAYAAVAPVWTGGLIAAPHPAARQADVVFRLTEAADRFSAMKARAAA